MGHNRSLKPTKNLATIYECYDCEHTQTTKGKCKNCGSKQIASLGNSLVDDKYPSMESIRFENSFNKTIFDRRLEHA